MCVVLFFVISILFDPHLRICSLILEGLGGREGDGGGGGRVEKERETETEREIE